MDTMSVGLGCFCTNESGFALAAPLVPLPAAEG